MGQPFVGEIRMFGGNFAPAGWAFCDGSLMPISENETLFQLIGTTYGGDGQNTFALPDLRGRVPVHMGTGPGLTVTIGEQAGSETTTLTPPQIPVHSHPLVASSDTASQTGPAANVLAQPPSGQLYLADTPGAALSPASLTQSGGNQAHENMGPFLCVNFIISLFGIFPSPT